MSIKTAPIETLIEANDLLYSEFLAAFSALTSQQLNWKPNPDAWSIAQCAEHLLKTNNLYLDRLEEVLAGTYQAKFLEKVPGMTRLGASLLFWGMTTTKKLKAPKEFVPSSSEVSPAIIDDFLQQHKRMKSSMQRCNLLKAENKTFTSPAAAVFVFNLLDMFRISTLHSQRHFQQAQRVKNNPKFPS